MPSPEQLALRATLRDEAIPAIIEALGIVREHGLGALTDDEAISLSEGARPLIRALVPIAARLVELPRLARRG